MTGTLEKASAAAPWSITAKALRFALSLATSMVVVRLLPAYDYGVLAIVRTAIAFVAALVGAGMGNALIRYLPERRAAGREAAGLLRFCGGAQAAGWILFVLIAWLLRDRVDALYGSPLGTPLLAGAAFLSGNLLFTMAANGLTATFRTRRLAVLQGISSLAVLLLSYAALRAGWGVVGVLGAASLPYLLLGVWELPRLFRSFPGESAPGEHARILRFALPLALIEVLNLITWRQSETLLLGHYRTPVEAGIFDIAYRLPQILLEFVPETIWPLVLAAFVEVYTRDRRKVSAMIRHYFRLLFFLVTPITLFGALYGDILIQTLYGAERAASGPYARIFFAIFHLSFFGTPFSMALYLIEKTWVNLVLSAVFAVVNLGLDFILIPRYGLIGAVPPVAIAVAISPILRAWAVRRFHGSIPIPWRFLGRCYLASAPILLLYPMRAWAGSASGFLALALVSVVLFFVAIRVVRLVGPEEQALLERSRLPGKDVWRRWFY